MVLDEAPPAPPRAPHHDHACLIYRDEPSRDAALCRFVEEGLANNERVLAVAEAAGTDALLAALAARGIDAGHEVAQGRLLLPSVADTYLRDGAFDPARMLEMFVSLAAESVADGYAGLRVTGSGAWALADGRISDLLQYERQIDNLFAGDIRLTALCQYDERLFEPSVLAEVLRTHPLVIYEGVPGPNPFYMPRGDDAAQVRSMLARLREAREMVAAAEFARAQADMIIENAADGILISDAGGRLLDANAHLCRLLGRAHQELVGLPVLELLEDEPSGSDLELERAAAGESVTSHRRLRGAGGSPLPVDVTAARMPDGRYVAIVRDARPRLAAEAQAEADARADKLRALGGMAGGIAHDLNQSLALVVGHAELALRSTDASEELEGIIRAATDAAATIKALLTFARPDETEERVPIDVAALLADVAAFTRPRWDTQARKEGRSVQVTVDAIPGTLIVGARGSLHHAMTNLVFNAIEAMPDGGRVVLRARVRPTEVSLEVEDSGTGIEPANLPRLGEPFFTTKGARGNGLGLAMVYSIAAQHGGTLQVTSAPGAGSSFALVLPRFAGPAEAAPGASAAAESQTRRVLVVDDEPLLGTLFARLLEREGHSVKVAQSGEAALQVVPGFMPDVIITDVTMGAGMTGWDLAAAVLERWPRITVYLASGWAPELSQEKAAATGVAGILSKPVSRDDLVAAVSRVPPAT